MTYGHDTENNHRKAYLLHDISRRIHLMRPTPNPIILHVDNMPSNPGAEAFSVAFEHFDTPTTGRSSQRTTTPMCLSTINNMKTLRHSFSTSPGPCPETP